MADDECIAEHHQQYNMDPTWFDTPEARGEMKRHILNVVASWRDVSPLERAHLSACSRAAANLGDSRTEDVRD